MSKNKLETLVPPLELCNLIPEGAFADSALIWHVQGSPVGYMKDLERRDELHAERFGVVLPAPTLVEILVELARTRSLISVTAPISGGWQVYGWKTQVEEDRNPAIAALKLWLELKGEGEK